MNLTEQEKFHIKKEAERVRQTLKRDGIEFPYLEIERLIIEGYLAEKCAKSIRITVDKTPRTNPDNRRDGQASEGAGATGPSEVTTGDANGAT